MLEPMDWLGRDSTLFRFTTRRLRSLVDPDPLPTRADQEFDSGRLMASLGDHYCPGNGRPAIHSDVMIRALLIRSPYNISSFCGLSSAIVEILAYRWSRVLAICACSPRQKDCQARPVRGGRPPPNQKRRYLRLTICYSLHLQARERNRSTENRQEINRRRTNAEGTFASLEPPGWAVSRLRGLCRVDCEGFKASMAHNPLKTVRRPGQGRRPPCLIDPTNIPSTKGGAFRVSSIGNLLPQPRRMLNAPRL